MALTVIPNELYILQYGSEMSMISIVIPHYNQPSALLRSVKSIAHQTISDYEVIVVDDGSTQKPDETALRNILPNITLIQSKVNRGAPSARNIGLAHARGDYIIFWDADVIAEPAMLEEMQEVLEANDSVDFVYSSFYFGEKLFRAREFSVSVLRENNYIHSTSLLRRDVAIEWDPTLKRFQDWDYWLRLSQCGSIGVAIDTPLFTVLPGGTMSNWLPRFAYHIPWKLLPGIRARVKKYERAMAVIKEKHDL